MTERQFITAMEALGFEVGEAACRAALAAALGLPYEDALEVERKILDKERKKVQHDTKKI